ncbi:MAG: RNA methyltransferase [Cyclobacteriaceae bacterium]|nr:RNA methyltransferase [Cyclobacteriaceae bacterium]MCX7637329.1 RNA methyltransferase [Cyclobacteriaceae bacterium]MDW8330412.1 RNA methyltransferase [Cyclobacteriaceae bacterium]
MRKLKLDELGRISVEVFKASEKLPVCIVLDNIRSLHNVGSVFRTADAFRIQKIFLTGITGTPPHREIHKTALGATESVDWVYMEKPETAVRQLKEEGYTIAVVEQTDASIPLQNFHITPRQKLALVFGNEIHGVSDEVIALADAALEVPQSGTKHSLNVSVCAGIVVWELVRKLKFAGAS